MKNRKTIFILFFFSSFLFLLTACNRSSDTPTASKLSPSPLISFANNASGLRANLTFLGSLSNSATIYAANWPWSYPTLVPTIMNDGNLTTYIAYPGFEDHSGEITLTWSTPQQIARLKIYASRPMENCNLSLSYNSSSEFESWANVPSVNWVTNYDNPTDTNGVIISASFPSIYASSIRLSISNANPTKNFDDLLYIAEFAVFEPKLLEITSPADNSQFSLGENIGFSSNSTVTLTDYLWSYDGNPLGLTPYSPNTVASNLTPGTHTILLTAQTIGSSSYSVSDSISIYVSDIAKIKVKANNQVVSENETLELSSLGALTNFEAIGYSSDNTEVGPVAVKWELSEGEVGANQPIRNGILTELNSNIGKIGVLSHNNATSSVVLDSKTVNFVSFLSGTIKLTASLPNVEPVTINIRLKQPTVYINLFAVEGLPDLTLWPIWLSKAQNLWGQEGLINIKDGSVQFISDNVFYPPLPITNSGESLLQEKFNQVPHFHNSLLQDLYADKAIGLSGLDIPHVVPRQTEELLHNRIQDGLNCYFIKAPYVLRSPRYIDQTYDFRMLSGAKAISSRDSVDRHTGLSLNDSVQSGIVLGYRKVGIYSGEDLTIEKRFIAHEIGHLLNLNHVENDNSNLMDEYVSGEQLTPKQFVTVLNYSANNNLSQIFLREE